MTKSHCSWTLFSWKFAPRPKIQNIFSYTGQHYHHITRRSSINRYIISFRISNQIWYHNHQENKLWKITKSYCSWTLFSWKFEPKTQNSKYQFRYTMSTLSSSINEEEYQIISIIISHHHIISSVKNFEKWLTLTVHEPFFPGNLAQDPKFKIFLMKTGQHYHHITSSYHIVIITSSYQIIISYHQ